MNNRKQAIVARLPIITIRLLERLTHNAMQSDFVHQTTHQGGEYHVQSQKDRLDSSTCFPYHEHAPHLISPALSFLGVAREIGREGDPCAQRDGCRKGEIDQDRGHLADVGTGGQFCG